MLSQYLLQLLPAHFPLRRDEYRRVANYIPENLDAEDYEPASWHALARTVHDKQVPGDHNTCVTTFAGVIANELQGILANRNTGREMR
jgi:hypothetical protein